MGSFSVKAIDATIGEWRWTGFADRDADGPHANERTLALAGGPTWTFGEPVDDDWRAVALPVSHVARKAIDGAWFARRRAEGAMWRALNGPFRDLELRRTVDDEREVEGEPRCAVELHGLHVRFTFGDGSSIDVRGGERRQRVTGPNATPDMLRAARFAHLVAGRLAAASLLDAAATPLGDHVLTLEQALDEVAAYTW